MSQNSGYDVAVIGGGVAGMTAALILARACRRVVLFDEGNTRNSVVRHAHNFLTRDGASPAELRRIGRAELKRYGVTIIQARVDKIGKTDADFRLQLQSGLKVVARKILLATGVVDKLPDIPGLRPLWGKRVFLCPYCDGWEFRDQPIAVIGEGKAGYRTAMLLREWTDKLVLCLDGGAPPSRDHIRKLRQKNVTILPARVARVQEAKDMLKVTMSDGTAHSCSALFLHPPSQGADRLALKLGCRRTEDERQIHIDAAGRTSVRGVYAAGDIVTPQSHLVTAAASGAVAAFALNTDMVRQGWVK
ncbi:MAG TPA: NAD(P)/FAD-dependent oxidoreductase [Patescibacteria group bacterium]|nr:NAD(P)/FAD-dependent oxidoreductase [Patescibacteria group bacterium]